MENNRDIFTALSVIPDYDKGRIVYWTIDPVFNGQLPHIFTLQGSEDPTFSQIVYTNTVGDSFFAVDSSKLIQTFNQSFLYRVQLVDGAGNIYLSKSIYYDGLKVERQKYIYAAEIVRKETLRTTQYTGFIHAWLLKRKTFAPIVPEYVDSVSQVPLSYSSKDFATGEQGGYYAPIKIFYSREEHVHGLKLSEQGTGAEVVDNIKARMIGFPLISPYDILVTPNGERYTISESQPRYFPGTNVILVQNCDARIIPNTDPVYSIPVGKE